MRVLLADDSKTIRSIIRHALESLDVTSIQEAADGRQAIELFKSQIFDLILTNWNMPGMTGIEVTRAIRAIDRAVPIIMVTTESDRARVIEAIEAGVTDYLVKPFTTDVLKRKLERFTVQA